MQPIRPVSLEADLVRWRSRFPDATPIGDLVPRRPATVVGVVTRMRVMPGAWLRLRISDGTGEAEAEWTGRSELHGIDLGAGVQLTATAAAGPDDLMLLRNPAWSVLAAPFNWPGRSVS